jgi:apolipoprotein N-acyltransferase
VSQAWRRISWDGRRPLVVWVFFEFHKYLGERGIQWSPLVISEIPLYLLVLLETVIQCGLGLLLFLGFLGGRLLLLLRVTEKGSEHFLLINILVHLYHKGMKILRWFQRQISHQWSVFFQSLENRTINESSGALSISNFSWLNLHK